MIENKELYRHPNFFDRIMYKRPTDLKCRITCETMNVVKYKTMSNKNNCLFGSQFFRSEENAMQSWWVAELPAVLPECLSGFMWVAVSCCDSDALGVLLREKETCAGVPIWWCSM